jgi:hypothetical protein
MKLLISSSRGSASAIAVLALGAAVGTAFYMSKRMGKLSQEGVSQAKNIRISPLKEKLSRLGGFLISSNLIVCRSGKWMDGGKGDTCRWNSKNYAGSSSSYDPKDFSLVDKGLIDGKKLKFDVKVLDLFEELKGSSLLTGRDTWITFKLLKSSDLKFNLGKLTKEQAVNDQDEYLIVMEGNIRFNDIGKKVKSARFKTAFRRPIAVPKVEVTSSSCAQRCDVSLTENPSPACRSTFYIDEETMTDVSATTMNLGPGSLYDLVYTRSVAYKSGVSLKESGATKVEVSVNVDDFLVPGGKKAWADNFPCATLSESKSETKTVFNPAQFLEFLSPPLMPLRFLIPTSAHAQMTKVSAGTSTSSSLSQHSNPAGTIIYQVGTDGKSLIEPFRMTAPITPVPQSFKGLMNTTTTTNFYTWVYISPPH